MASLKDLLVNGPSRFIGDLFANKVQLTSLEAPTSSNGITYGPGTNGQVLKTNGSSVYWSSDSDLNYYPTTWKWTNGTSSGPTATLSGTGMSNVSIGAVPAASTSQSGVITTGNQTFAGNKTFSGSLNGNATSATKWQTARTFTVGNEGKAVDGSANIVFPHPLKIYYYGSDVADTNGWYKMCTVSQTGFTDYNLNLLITSGFSRKANGLLHIHVRCNNDPAFSATLKWMYRYGFDEGDIYFKSNGDNTWSLYAQQTVSRWGRIQVQILTETNIAAQQLDMQWSSNTIKEAAAPTGGIAATDGATVAVANQLGITTIGSATKFIYLNAGVPTASNVTVGDTRTPIYLKDGSITQCSNMVRHLGDPQKTNMNDIGRLHASVGMTELKTTGNSTDNPFNGTTESTGWHLYQTINYKHDPSGDNAWVGQIVNKAGSSQWWVRSRRGGTITNGTAWDSPWRHLVTSDPSGIGSAAKPIYVNQYGEVIASNATIGSVRQPVFLNAGTITACHQPTSGSWYNSVPYLYSDGGMDLGSYIDFHVTDSATNDYDVRITASTGGLTLSGTTKGTFSGNLSGTATYAKVLSLYESRDATTTLNKNANYGGKGSVLHLLATSSTLSTDNGKPPTDANVLQMNWDNNGGYDSQFAIATSANRAYFRSAASTKKPWREIVHIAGNTTTGSATVPVYVKNDGVVVPITSYSGNAATATSIKPIYLAYEGTDGSIVGYRLIYTFNIKAWSNSRMSFVCNSRHAGSGFISIAVSCNSATVSQENVRAEIRYWGPHDTKVLTIQPNSYQIYVSADGTKAYLFWRHHDSSNCNIYPLGGDSTHIVNGPWMTSIDTATYGTLKAQTLINNATTATNDSGGNPINTTYIKKSVLSGAYDIMYSSAANTPARLAANTTTTKKFLRMTGTGSAGAVPVWDTVTKADVGLGNVTNDAQIPKSIGTNTGDLIYWSASNTPTRLGIGSNNQVLKIVNGVPAWSTDNDTKVTQTLSSTINADYRILFSHTADDVTHTEGARKDADFKWNPSTNTLTAANVKGRIIGGQKTDIELGQRATAEGFNNTASGHYSHAEGFDNTAGGSCSHAEGFDNTAGGSCSHAEGSSTVASADYQHVQGQLNIEDPEGTYAHIVGNGKWASIDNGDGTTFREEARSNAHTLDWDGNAWYAGKVSAGTVDAPANPIEANDLATKAYVDNATKVFWGSYFGTGDDWASPLTLSFEFKPKIWGYLGKRVSDGDMQFSPNGSLVILPWGENTVEGGGVTVRKTEKVFISDRWLNLTYGEKTENNTTFYTVTYTVAAEDGPYKNEIGTLYYYFAIG